LGPNLTPTVTEQGLNSGVLHLQINTGLRVYTEYSNATLLCNLPIIKLSSRGFHLTKLSPWSRMLGPVPEAEKKTLNWSSSMGAGTWSTEFLSARPYTVRAGPGLGGGNPHIITAVSAA